MPAEDISFIPGPWKNSHLLKKVDVGVSPQLASISGYPDSVKGTDNLRYSRDVFATWLNDTTENTANVSGTSASATSAFDDPGLLDGLKKKIVDGLLGNVVAEGKRLVALTIIILVALIFLALGLWSLTK